MANYDDLDEFRESLKKYLNNSRTTPFTTWVYPSISPQLMPLTGELDVVVEVLESYDNYDELEVGDRIKDAPAELGKVGQLFVSELENEVGDSIELPLDEEGRNAQGVSAKFYNVRVPYDT